VAHLKDSIRIEMKNGPEVRTLVDPFYAIHGSRGSARDADVFFLAMEKDRLTGCVRYCVEQQTPLLRTMMIDQKLRRKGIGLMLLEKFAAYLDQNNIHNVFCLPYAHLEAFYGTIGFHRVDTDEIPAFLLERMGVYEEGGSRNICMRRP
jgi:N-acetylglutamate synthase-like GNAT family acetyltransferase